jgi:hypothetical protein
MNADLIVNFILDVLRVSTNNFDNIELIKPGLTFQYIHPEYT